MRLAGAIGVVRLAVRGFGFRSRVHGFAVCGSWVRRSWVRCSWVMGSLFVGSWVRGFAVRGFVGSPFTRESFLSLFLSLRVSGNDLKRKFGLKIISVGESSACACAW